MEEERNGLYLQSRSRPLLALIGRVLGSVFFFFPFPLVLVCHCSYVSPLPYSNTLSLPPSCRSFLPPLKCPSSRREFAQYPAICRCPSITFWLPGHTSCLFTLFPLASSLFFPFFLFLCFVNIFCVLFFFLPPLFPLCSSLLFSFYFPFLLTLFALPFYLFSFRFCSILFLFSVYYSLLYILKVSVCS